MSTQTIHRKYDKTGNGFYMCPVELAQNKELSFAARGMLIYIMSLPNGLVFDKSDLLQLCTEDDVNKLLGELTHTGYVQAYPVINMETNEVVETRYKCSDITEVIK